MMGTQSPLDISTRLQRIAELARREPKLALNTLAHHIDIEVLHEAYRRTRKDGAVGVDGGTAASYAKNLDENLRRLLDRFKSGTYFAPPVRRVHIPKGDGSKTRPIGIPTFEDKILQRAVAMLLEAIYEEELFDCSYGFRSARSVHDALQALWDGLMKMHGACTCLSPARSRRGRSPRASCQVGGCSSWTSRTSWITHVDAPSRTEIVALLFS